eukprot:snap_masked-scaffold_36-processed-gene-2.58-mRNA-1 protein AED:1.00 eAED:1.00 QI:0/-1/0/0/-1/1/1/0/469
MNRNQRLASGRSLRTISISSTNPLFKENENKEKITENGTDSQLSRKQRTRKYKPKRVQHVENRNNNRLLRISELPNNVGRARRASSSRLRSASKSSEPTKTFRVPKKYTLSRTSGLSSSRQTLQNIFLGSLSRTFRKKPTVEVLEDSGFSIANKSCGSINAPAATSMSLSSIPSQPARRGSETKSYKLRPAPSSSRVTRQGSKPSLPFLSKRQDSLDEIYLYPAFTHHQPCEKCSTLIKTPTLSSLFAGSTVLGDTKSTTVRLRYARRNRNFAKKLASREKKIEILWQFGKIFLQDNDIPFVTFHVSDICNIELGTTGTTTLLVSAYYILNESKKDSEAKREDFLFSFSSVKETEEWTELLLQGLKSMVLVYDEVLTSIKEQVHWLNREHEECLLRKKARAMDLCLPVGDEAVLQGYKDIVSYLLLTRNHDDATTFMNKVEELQNINTQSNDPLNVLKHKLVNMNDCEV